MSDPVPTTEQTAALAAHEKHAAEVRKANEGKELDMSNPVHAACLQRLSDLEASLLAKDPMMKNHLLEIHKQLIGYEELVHLLTDEQIGTIMAAQQQHTNTVLIGSTSTASGKKKAAAAASKLTISDL